ncbi:MAG TPA: hypothetical protein VE998_04455 [Terriglobales bacterium]|nr:hypothetical protein [Terriglobales bacterium]
MTNQGSEPPGKAHICIWCESQYAQPESRARSSELFCSQKCEVEARYWLVSELQALA